MGNFVIDLSYAMFIVSIIMLLLSAFIFSKIPRKQWANWYSETPIIQTMGTALFFMGFLFYATFYSIFKNNEVIALSMVLIGCIFVLAGLFFSIRAIVLITRAREKNKTF